MDDKSKIGVGAGLAAVLAGVVLLVKKQKEPPVVLPPDIPPPEPPPVPPPPGLATIYGIVFDADTGLPRSGVAVGLLDSDGAVLLRETVTDAVGYYSIEGIEPGDYLLSVQQIGYDELNKFITINEGETEVNLMLVPEPEPGVIIDFPNLIIQDVEGIPFTTVGMETDWSKEDYINLLTYWTGVTNPYASYIERGHAEDFADFTWSALSRGEEALFEALLKAGKDHPEWLAFLGNERGTHYSVHYAEAYEWWEESFRVEGSCLVGVTSGVRHCVGDKWDAQIGFHLIHHRIESISAGAFTYSITYDWWSWTAIADFISKRAMIEVTQAPVLTATLAEPISMSKLRGVSLTVVGKDAVCSVEAAGHGVSTENYLWYQPVFIAEGSPPGFRGGGSVLCNKPNAIDTTGLFAAGRYFPGVYNGTISIRWFDSTIGREYATYVDFRIKGLAHVTGKGVIT